MSNGTNTKTAVVTHQEFLVSEFNYIAQTAFQAHEDRARISEFFLLSFGTYLVALFSTQITNIALGILYILFSFMFIVVAFLGILTIMEIGRLRLAWIESVFAMNKMKNKVMEDNSELKDCFEWTDKKIPPAYKSESVGYLKSLQVAVLSGIALGATSAFVALAIGFPNVPWFLSIVVAILSAYMILARFYIAPLQKYDKNDRPRKVDPSGQNA